MVWEKTSYNMPAFHLNGSLVSYAVWKRHIGFYPRTPDMEATIEGISAYKGTKESLHLPLNHPLPFDLARQKVKFRVAENHPTR